MCAAGGISPSGMATFRSLPKPQLGIAASWAIPSLEIPGLIGRRKRPGGPPEGTGGWKGGIKCGESHPDAAFFRIGAIRE